MEMIHLFYPQIYKEEWLETLEKVFSGKQIAQGGIVDKFDKEFGKKFGGIDINMVKKVI